MSHMYVLSCASSDYLIDYLLKLNCMYSCMFHEITFNIIPCKNYKVQTWHLKHFALVGVCACKLYF